MLENIIAGLVSGVLATLLVFVFRSVWNGVVVPWFEERIYKDIRIEGAWYSFYPSSSDKRQEVISIERQGHAVTGKITCSNGNDSGETYLVAGSFRNMLLPLTYESADSKKSDRGTITMQSVHNGERFVGKLAFYFTTQDEISTIDVIWFRSKTDLEKYVEAIEKNRETIQELKNKVRHIEKELKIVEGVIEQPPEDQSSATEDVEAKADANG